MIEYSGTYVDQYELTMAQVLIMKDKQDDRSVFDYFFRKLPFEGGYAVFAGLDTLLDALEGFRFHENEIEFLAQKGMDKSLLKFLKDFRFQGTIYAMQEGEIVFPTLPILSVEANLVEAQLIETLLLNILNFQTLIATKASRMRQIAGDRSLVDFGLRRAQGPAGYYASRAAVIGGFNATSNAKAGFDFDIPISGTMAHAFIQSYDDELPAFRAFAEGRPDDCVLLVDTYDTLKSGVPNAIKVGLEMKARGHHLKGIRLDSGDLAYLSRKARKMLDEAGLQEVKIAASNQLDEYVIKSLLEQNAPIDLFGVGTNLVTGHPDAALDGVYKLVLTNGEPRIKLSESTSKITLPYQKQVFRLFNSEGNFYGADAAALIEEEHVKTMHHPFEPLKSLYIDHYRQEPLLQAVMINGERKETSKSLKEIQTYSFDRLKKLPQEFKRFDNPHIYKVGLSDELHEARQQLIKSHRKLNAE